jgi:CRP-like cAMP-binding protein
MIFSPDEIQKLLSEYFPDLGKKELDLFLSICKYGVAKNKQTILECGGTDNNLIFILKGIARAYEIDDKGHELNNYIRAEGHLIGDAKSFGDEVHSLTTESIGEVHYLLFDIRKLESLGYDNPKIMKFYLDFLNEIILTLSYRLHTFVTMTPEERYTDLIKWNPILIESAFDKHLASFLGIKPLTIHRIKKKIRTN